MKLKNEVKSKKNPILERTKQIPKCLDKMEIKTVEVFIDLIDQSEAEFLVRLGTSSFQAKIEVRNT